MHKFITVVIAVTLSLAIASPSFAGGRHYRQDNDAALALGVLGFGVALGIIVGTANNDRHYNGYQRHGNRDRYSTVPQRNRYRLRPPHGSWIIRSGDYCEGRMYHYHGRYYCGR